MIIEFLNTSESLYSKDIPEHDRLVIEELFDKYGYSEMFNCLNEASYYGNDGGFNRTGGSRVRRIGGALQSIPSFLISASISWPMTLLSAIGAVSHRMRKKFEDKNSWLNRLNPAFWNDYVGTYHEREGRKKKSSSTNDNGKTWVDRVYDKVTGAGAAAVGAGAGLLAGKALSDKDKEETFAALTKEDVVNTAFVPYWVTLSNGEVLRFRASSPEDAKILANMVIAYTEKDCYEAMNYGIKNQNYKRYKFQFSDGEVCYWAAKTKENAYEKALTTRVELCSQMNQINPDVVKLDNLEEPEIVGNVEVSREPIPIPEKNKFLSVSTEKPEFKKNSEKKLSSPIYMYGTLEHYKASFSNFVFNFPATNQNSAIDITRDISRGNDAIDSVYNGMRKKLVMYKVVMKDGDVYHIPSDNENGASDIAEKLYRSKVISIKKVLTGEDLAQYSEFMTEYGNMISGIKSISQDKDYSLKDGSSFNLYRYRGKEKDDIDNLGKYNF